MLTKVQSYCRSTPLSSLSGLMKWDMQKYPRFSLIVSIFEKLTFSFLSWFRNFKELNLTELFRSLTKNPFRIILKIIKFQQENHFKYKEQTALEWAAFNYHLESVRILRFHSAFPTNISTSDQRCFNTVDQSSSNVDLTLKMKQNLTSDFKRCTTLTQRQYPTLKQSPNNVPQRCINVVSM